jgi:hypothetical protein
VDTGLVTGMTHRLELEGGVFDIEIADQAPLQFVEHLRGVPRRRRPPRYERHNRRMRSAARTR